MPQKDSLILSSTPVKAAIKAQSAVSKPKVFATIPDTVVKMNPDSVHLKDSILRADSLHKADSLKAITLKKTSGYAGKPIPSYPYTENWVFIALVLLFLVLTGGLHKSAGNLWKGVKSFFNKKEALTSSAPSINLPEYRIYFSILIVGVVSLFFYESIFEAAKGFHFIPFVKILGITALFYIAKVLLIEFIGHVFFNIKQIKLFKEIYFNLAILFSIALFPLLVIRTYHPLYWAIPYDIIAFVLILIFYISLLIKVFQIFFTKILDSFYIFLYLCTLEILPLVLLFRVYNLIV